MKIHFKPEGGIAFFPGLNKTLEINSDDLTAEERQHLGQLIDEADFFNIPSITSASKQGRDMTEYTITIEDGAQKHTATVSNIEPDSKIQNLLNYLRKKQKEGQRK